MVSVRQAWVESEAEGRRTRLVLSEADGAIHLEVLRSDAQGGFGTSGVAAISRAGARELADLLRLMVGPRGEQ